jgi:hypothetical protein
MTLGSWLRGDVPVIRLAAARERCAVTSETVEALPRGPARSAAWSAYALVTYGDELLEAGADAGYVDGDTARVAAAAYELAARCLEPAARIPGGLPPWAAGARSMRQLRGMRDALDTLRTFLAFDLGPARLAVVDAHRAKASSLWIARPTAELRGGIAGALVSGLEAAYSLGVASSSERAPRRAP